MFPVGVVTTITPSLLPIDRHEIDSPVRTIYTGTFRLSSSSSRGRIDPLSDVLALLKPRSYLTAGFDAGGDWAVRFDNQAGHIKCYAITSGSCLLAVDGVDEPVQLVSGDCFVLPSGRSFTLASDLAVSPKPAGEVFAGARYGGVVVHNGGGDLFLTGTRFDVDGRQARALLGALPPIVRVEASED